jgi:hypothetical protein
MGRDVAMKWVCLALVMTAGCLDPKPPSGAFRCGPDDSCPAGYHCTRGECWRDGEDPDLSVVENPDLTAATSDLADLAITPDSGPPAGKKGDACGGGQPACEAGLFCVDGRCCDGACTDACKACNVPGLEGTCSNVVAGSAPSHGSCNAEAASTCGRDGTCDGAGACRKHVQGTVCVAASCNTSTDVFTPAKKCDGAGTCVNETAVSCTPYKCKDTTACHNTCSDNNQCLAPNSCSSMSCGKLPDGRSCTMDVQCLNNHCVDGVCCDTTCTGQCEACNVPGSLGVCRAVSGAPVAPRTACTGTGSSCGGMCNGTNRTACIYPTTSCRSQSCTGSTLTLAANCNAGVCPTPPTTQACGDYVCNGSGTACRTDCGGDGDCANPVKPYCNGGVCLATLPNGRMCGSGADCTTNNCVNNVCCDTSCTGALQGGCELPELLHRDMHEPSDDHYLSAQVLRRKHACRRCVLRQQRNVPRLQHDQLWQLHVLHRYRSHPHGLPYRLRLLHWRRLCGFRSTGRRASGLFRWNLHSHLREQHVFLPLEKNDQAKRPNLHAGRMHQRQLRRRLLL